MVRSNKPKGRPPKCGACNQLGHYHKYIIFPMIDNTMKTNDTQYSSQVGPSTLTSSILVNIEQGGGMM